MLLVTYWLVVTLGSQFSIDLPGLLDDVWGSGAPGVAGFALGLGVGLYVGRWWVVFAALTPYAVLGALELAGHVAPWHDAGPPLTQYPLQFLFWTLVWFYVLPIAFGVLVRRGLGPRGVLYGS